METKGRCDGTEKRKKKTRMVLQMGRTDRRKIQRTSERNRAVITYPLVCPSNPRDGRVSITSDGGRSLKWTKICLLFSTSLYKHSLSVQERCLWHQYRYLTKDKNETRRSNI